MLLSASLPIRFCLVLFLSTFFLPVAWICATGSLPFSLGSLSLVPSRYIPFMCEVRTIDAVICIWFYHQSIFKQREFYRNNDVKFHNWIVFTWIEHVRIGSFTVRPLVFSNCSVSTAWFHCDIWYHLGNILISTLRFFLVRIRCFYSTVEIKMLLSDFWEKGYLFCTDKTPFPLLNISSADWNILPLLLRQE